MAGYFTSKWSACATCAKEAGAAGCDGWSSACSVLPVMIAVGCSLLLFFLLKDLGPALVTGFLFLVMFALARGRPGLALAGIVLLVAGVALGYRLGEPKTVVNRITMWLSPWDNDVHGGDQLAHSLWALSTGGMWGSGPGWAIPS
jgi:cell division protein FtsW (lipid II flippase)